MRAFPPLTCENGNGPNRCVNTDPGLTRSPDYGRKGLGSW